VTPLVVKLGGSLAESDRLRSALHLVARARRPVVVVPGGGIFADAVRTSQAALGFDDETAHGMALLAMHQMATAMMAIEPRLVAAETLADMRRAWRRGRAPVWLPSRLCKSDRRIPRDWSVTSDGLAARLAERLGDVEVALVKSCPVKRAASARTLAREGVVDPVFPTIVERAGIGWCVLGPGDEPRLAGLLNVSSTHPAPRSTARKLRATAVA